MASNDSALNGLRKFINKFSALSASLRNDKDDFLVEFLLIKQEASEWKEQGKCASHEGAREINRKKNRYKDILPHDATRVILPKNGGDGSDYINANYIKGPTGDVEYIASQGPMPATVEDFWRMIWKHKPKVIAMLCKEIELGKHRCQRYWPEEKEEMKFGEIRVTLISDKNIGDNLHLRRLKYTRGKEEFALAQIHYTAWPDHGAPDSSTPILHLIEQMREERGNSHTPIVVHCSAGCGRTGAVIAIDYARKLIDSKAPELSIIDIVKKLRMQRPAMVQSREQYEYVYDVVNELAEREMQRIDVHGSSGTYVNIQRFKSKEDSIYANAIDFSDVDVEGHFKRTRSLNVKTDAYRQGSMPPQLPAKSPKTERSASSSCVLGMDMIKGASLPNQGVPKKSREQEAPKTSRPNGRMEHDSLQGNSKESSRGSHDEWSASIVKTKAKEEKPATQNNSSGYEVPQVVRGRTTAISNPPSISGNPDGNVSRPPIATKPTLPHRITPSKLPSTSDPNPSRSSGNPPKAERPTYAPISKPPRTNAADNRYEQIWSGEKQPIAAHGNDISAPPLPERTPESFIPLTYNSQDYADLEDIQNDISSSPGSTEQSGWFSGKLKKIGNIMSPFSPPPQQSKSKGSTSSDSVFYSFDGSANEGKTRSLDRSPAIATYPTVELGFGKRLPVKPRGPRQPPSHWPNYPHHQSIGSSSN